jgi:7-cyano-7-deazaguanine synthase
MKDLAVVLLSGGLDSCVTAALAAQSHQLALLHLDYRQTTQERERLAFSKIADHYQVPQDLRLIVQADYLAQIGGSALTDRELDIPDADLESDEVPITYVPFRNAHLLSLGVSWAEVLKAGSVYVGAVEEDSSGYPDCTQAFFDGFSRVVSEGTRPETNIEVVTPVINMKKSQIVQLGYELEAPVNLSWSCYRREDRACGTCDSCALRLRAFEEAGRHDPIPYLNRSI